ncbi:hypothetical protein F4780DRAFT_726942 [Xylariomycetidae sp. FL0641]|nr:hypothetical protein F4780DRAFT_726942 [Xylariomycetidae sp. FL0641]
MDLPSFSPFPKVQGEHIPPSDEEKEAVLAESRHHVLHSNDPDMQICWARDVLTYVEVAAEAAIREIDAVRGANDRELPSRPTTPQIEHELRLDAINIVSYLADQGHPEALFIRSKWLEFGKFGRRQDKKEAYSGYLKAAQQGWGRADYRIGMLYENSNDMEKAIRHYNSGLGAKDSAASYRVGMISLMGQRGMPKDVNRGLDLISQAADTADEDAPQGAFVYGMLVARDLPDVTIPEGALTSDMAVARQYIEKAAYLGFAKAQLKMGQAYELCQLGCDFDPALSLHYYGLAARQGQPEACLGVSRWFLFGYEGTFAKNEQLAYKYAQLAAKQKLPTGEFAMGYYNEIGISVEKDVREARKWYELAAEHGNKDAVGRLEGLSQSKTLSKKDHETSTLTRIKSQHGSQMGNPMPALSEDRSTPRPSPRNDGFNMPDPSRPDNNGRGPAFTVNLAERPKSAAPYPEDDRPAPLNVSRPGTAAPYPDDDTVGPKPQLSPHYNANARPSGERNSAFGIRPSQSAGQLPLPASGGDPNWNRPVSAGYRQPSPGSRTPEQRPGSSGHGPNSPGPNRLVKGGPGGPGLPGSPSAGRGGPPGQFKPRESSLPVGHAPGPRAASGPAPYDYNGGRASAAPGGMGSPVMSGGLGGPPGHRVNSSGSGRPGVALSDGPPMGFDQAGRASAPPGRPNVASPAPSVGGSVASAPAGKPAAPGKQGPATFEQMGIPQHKEESDCVVM